MQLLTRFCSVKYQIACSSSIGHRNSVYRDNSSELPQFDPIIVTHWDAKRKLVSVSKSFTSILGWTKKEIDSQQSIYAFKISFPGHVATRMHRNGYQVKLEKIWEGESAKGGYFQVEKLLPNPYDSIALIHKPSVVEFQDFLENGSIPLQMVGFGGKIIWTNKAEAAMLGYEIHEIVGKHMSYFHEDKQTAREIAQAVRQGETLTDFQANLIRKCGSVINVQICTSASRDETGRLLHTRCFIRDVTAAQALSRVQAETLEERLRFKSEFIATMSHEMRTPLNSVRGMTSLLLESPLLAEQHRDCVEDISSSAEMLLHLVNDVLDMSKLEAGQLEIESFPFDAEGVMHEVCHVSKTAAAQKGVQLKIQSDIVQSPFQDDFTHIGDPFRVKQILLNFLNNAIKFTDQGSITANVTILSGDMQTDQIMYSVSDTGIGISDTSTVFSPFFQADSAISRKYGGIGLGLSICQKLATAMEGETGVSSKLDEGSTFWLKIPLKRLVKNDCTTGPSELKTQLTPKTSQCVQPQNCRILIAEDNKVNIKVCVKMLSRLGFNNVTVVENGLLAVDAITTSLKSSKSMFDLVLMDVQMPVMDGFEATSLIRSVMRGLPHLPILAVTAGSFNVNSQSFLQCGMDGIIHKPITLAILQTEITKVLAEVEISS